MQQAMELLTPWFTFVVILIPAIALERWIHQHLYGVGWLITQDKQQATILYYLILLPGIALHEFTQWLYAGVANLRTSKIKVWPKPQKNGTLRLDFVKLSSKKVGRVPRTIFEVAPILVGIAAILLISQYVMDASALRVAFATADLNTVMLAFQSLFSTPDFWLWLYLLFAIGNGMVPTDKLNTQWLLVIGIVISCVLLILGLLTGAGLPAIQTPVASILNTLATASSTILTLNLLAVVMLGLTERILERITGEQAKYPRPTPVKPTKPEPGGEAPLPEGQAPLRITERRLPIPQPPKTPRKPAVKPQATSEEAESIPSSTRSRASWVEQQEKLRNTSEDEQEEITQEAESPTDNEPPQTDASEHAPDTEPLSEEMMPASDEMDETETANTEDDDDLEYVDIDDIA